MTDEVYTEWADRLAHAANCGDETIGVTWAELDQLRRLDPVLLDQKLAARVHSHRRGSPLKVVARKPELTTVDITIVDSLDIEVG